MSIDKNLPQFQKAYYRKGETQYLITKRQTDNSLIQSLPHSLWHKERLYDTMGGYQVDCLFGDEYWSGKFNFTVTLQPAGFKDWFVGTFYARVICKKEVYFPGIMLFRFSKDKQRLHIFYFKEVKEATSYDRLAFCNYTIPLLEELKRKPIGPTDTSNQDDNIE